MYRCPRCSVELTAGASFCLRCGFDQLDAILSEVASPRAAHNKSNASIMPAPITPMPSIGPTLSTALPSTPLTPRPSSLRSFQPEARHSIPPHRPTPGEHSGSQRVPGTHHSMPFLQAENIPQQENEERVHTLRPRIDQAAPYMSHGEERPHETKLEDELRQNKKTNVPGFSLTKRYMAEQETRHQSSFSLSNTMRPEDFPTEPALGAMRLEDFPTEPGLDAARPEDFPTRPVPVVDPTGNKLW